jgi:NAD(P)-dependent dehydrogenase (short-subunit alcohol dehydrogenase family)
MATDMLEKDGEGAEDKLVMAIPMGRLAEVPEVMAGLRFLADPENSFVTGQTLHVDGGLSAR